MADIVKLNTVEAANIVKLNGVESFSKVLGQSKPATSTYTRAKSASFDGSNDYGIIQLDSTLAGSWGKTQGSYSAWINPASFDGSKALFALYESGAYNNFYWFMIYKVANNIYNFVARQRYNVNSVQQDFQISPLTSAGKTTYVDNGKGFPFARLRTGNNSAVDSSYISSGNGVNGGLAGGNFHQMLNRTDSSDTFYIGDDPTHGKWIHVVVTWNHNSSESFTGEYPPHAGGDNTTYHGATFNGKMQIFLNGELRNIGQSHGDPNSASQNYGLPLDGEVAFPRSMTTSRTANVDTIYLAGRNNAASAGTHQDIYIDDFAIFDVALDASNVTAMYNSGTPTDLTTASGNYNKQGNLAGYWKMETESSGVVTDGSGNGNNLTLYNGPSLVTEVPPNT